MDDMDEGFLKLTNHKDHPTNKAYKVFFFYEKEKANYFETSLEVLSSMLKFLHILGSIK